MAVLILCLPAPEEVVQFRKSWQPQRPRGELIGALSPVHSSKEAPGRPAAGDSQVHFVGRAAKWCG